MAPYKFDIDFDARARAVAHLEHHWTHCQLPEAPALRADIIDAHAGPDRQYHSVVHIAALRDWIAAAKPSPQVHQRLAWTALFHDYIYDTRRTDNEAASAEAAEERLAALDWPADERRRITEAIRRTHGHQGHGADAPTQLFLDLDLLILAAPPAVYGAYARAVRREYQWVPENQYLEGRRRVLGHFLHRNAIYFSDPIAQQFEAAARLNLKEELDQLST